jgi:hypothetical protein
MALFGSLGTPGVANTNIGYTPVNRGGDTLTGNINLPAPAAYSSIGSESNQAINMNVFSNYGRKFGYLGPSHNGDVWCRIALLNGRFAYRITCNTTGGWYAPGATIFHCLLDYGNTLYVSGTVKLGTQYVTQVRYQSNFNDGGVHFIEVRFQSISNLQGFHVAIENLNYNDQGNSGFNCAGSGGSTGTFGTSLSNLSFTGTAVTL